MENEFEEPTAEISYDEMSNVACFLEVSESDAAVTPGFDEPLAPKAAFHHCWKRVCLRQYWNPCRREFVFTCANGNFDASKKAVSCMWRIVLKKNFARHFKGHCDISFHCKECCKYFDTQHNLDI